MVVCIEYAPLRLKALPASVLLRFSPSLPGEFTASVAIESNDPSWTSGSVYVLGLSEHASDQDSDGDGVMDDDDNCVLEANADQRDTNGDRFGNRCDGDLNNKCAINFIDLGLMKGVFFSTDADADLNGNGAVSFDDLAILKEAFFTAPGPSATTSVCD